MSKSTAAGMLAHKGVEGIALTVAATAGESAVPPPEVATFRPAVPQAERSESAQLVRWLESEDEEDDDVLQNFQEGKVSSWDHRQRLRVAWSALKRHGRKGAMKLVFEGVKRIVK